MTNQSAPFQITLGSLFGLARHTCSVLLSFLSFNMTSLSYILPFLLPVQRLNSLLSDLCIVAQYASVSYFPFNINYQTAVRSFLCFFHPRPCFSPSVKAEYIRINHWRLVLEENSTRACCWGSLILEFYLRAPCDGFINFVLIFLSSMWYTNCIRQLLRDVLTDRFTLPIFITCTFSVNWNRVRCKGNIPIKWVRLLIR